MAEPVAPSERSVWAPVLLREPPPPGGGEIVSVDEVNARYLDEWVIMRVTAYEEGSGWPAEGYVIAHDPSEKRCWDKYRAAEEAGEPREATHYIFVAAPKVRTYAEMLAAMAQLDAEWPASEERRYRRGE